MLKHKEDCCVIAPRLPNEDQKKKLTFRLNDPEE